MLPTDSARDSGDHEPTTGAALRVATSNVCMLPLATRNKYCVAQLLASVASGVALLLLGTAHFAPSVPLALSLPLSLLLSLPLCNVLIPLEGALVWLASGGLFQDHKGARLQLLLERLLPALDVLCVQELFSGVFDSRYRDRLIQEAKKRGFQHSICCPSAPRWPSLLLNQGTLILSRYPIVSSRTLVFKRRALYDLLTVNRGAMWARVQLPNGHIVHVFTCHIAPPLVEVAGRVGGIMRLCTCPQQAQLDELLSFMRECISADLHADGSALCPFDVVLAGDFNLDCGSRRYFALLHALRSLLPDGRPMHDLFATEAEAEEQHVRQIECGQTADDNAEGATVRSKASLSHRHRHAPAGGPRSPESLSAVASFPPCPQTQPANLSLGAPLLPFDVSRNRWHPAHGNARERSDASSLQSFASVLPPPGRVLEWPPTFGQRVRVRDSGAGERCLESFLTHPSLLGCHSTHDYMFASCAATHTAVDPVLVPGAEARLGVRLHEAGEGVGDLRNGEERSSLQVQPPPMQPFSQLSDHSALIATLSLQPTVPVAGGEHRTRFKQHS